MENSILSSTKKILGMDASYTAFDLDVITHINSAFSTLNQLGIGPADGYMIEDATPTWDAFFGTNKKYNSIKTYVFFLVKLAFDPPSTSYLITAMEKQKSEHEWRLSLVREETEWVDPDPADLPEDTDFIIDGGGV